VVVLTVFFLEGWAGGEERGSICCCPEPELPCFFVLEFLLVYFNCISIRGEVLAVSIYVQVCT